MARYRLHHSLGRRAVVRYLHRWTKRHFSDQCRCRHQKLSDARLLALLLARFVFKHPYLSVWWSLLREGRHGLPSYTQAYTRGLCLLEKLEAIVTPSVLCKEVIIDSMPLPVCRPKRGKCCAFPGATWGYGTQGQVYGYKLHAWVSPTGTIVQYLLRPANLHDTTVGYELNRRWPDFGGPKIIGDKGYCSLGFFSSGQLRVKPRLVLRKEGSEGRTARPVLLGPIAGHFSGARNRSAPDSWPSGHGPTP